MPSRISFSSFGPSLRGLRVSFLQSPKYLVVQLEHVGAGKFGVFRMIFGGVLGVAANHVFFDEVLLHYTEGYNSAVI